MESDDVRRFLQKSQNPGELQEKISKADTVQKVDFTANIGTAPVVFKAQDDFIIWGPASVEVVDKEGDLIEASALSEALPQLLKRSRLSLEHSDQLVGEILERFETEQPVDVQVAGTTFKRSEFPTDVMELDGIEPALYVCGKVWDDTRQARETREKIEEGVIDSYSISGEALVTRTKVDDGEPYDEIAEIDLSAVTLCEDGMNQKSEFGVVAGGEQPQTTSSTESTVEPVTASRVAVDGQELGAVAKSAISKTMSDSDNESEASEKGDTLDMDALEERFKSVVEEQMPDGEIATKEDVEETIEEKVEETFEEKANDRASDQDDSDDGNHSDYEEYENPTEEGQSHTATVERSEIESAVEGVLKDAGILENSDEESEESEKSGVTLKEAAARLEQSFDISAKDVVKLARAASSSDVGVEKVTHFIKEGEMPPEMQGGGGGEGEDDDEEEEEEMPPEMGGEEEEEEDPNIENAREQVMEELKQDLPEDVWKVVNEYTDDPGQVPDAGAGGADQAPEQTAPEAGAGQKSKSDTRGVTQGDIEKAVAEVLKGEVVEKQDSIDAEVGSQGEQDAEPAFGKSDQGGAAESHPALANIYNGEGGV